MDKNWIWIIPLAVIMFVVTMFGAFGILMKSVTSVSNNSETVQRSVYK
jgi:hypothetical protein